MPKVGVLFFPSRVCSRNPLFALLPAIRYPFPLQNKILLFALPLIFTYYHISTFCYHFIITMRVFIMSKVLREIVTKEVLELKHGSSHDIDHLFAENYERLVAEGKLTNVCCKITPELFDRLTQTCAFLNISKRKFIEGAIIQGLDDASQVIEEYGLMDYLASESEAMRKWSEERKTSEGIQS